MGVISSATLSPTTYPSNSVSTFKITFTPANAISSTGSIVLHYPSQIAVDPSAACRVTTDAIYNDKCTIDTTAKTVTIKNAFSGVSSFST